MVVIAHAGKTPQTLRFPRNPTPLMHHAQHIRKLVSETFIRLGVAASPLLEETVLIRNGYFCGRRYHCNGFHAIWFVEENQVKVFDQQGTISEVFSADRLVMNESLQAA